MRKGIFWQGQGRDRFAGLDGTVQAVSSRAKEIWKRKMEHTLIVAGIGPGSKEYILPKALSVIEKARYLVGGHRALSDYGHAGQEMYPITGKLSLLADWMESALKKMM